MNTEQSKFNQSTESAELNGRSNLMTIKRLRQHIQNNLAQLDLPEARKMIPKNIINSSRITLLKELGIYSQLPAEMTLGEAIEKGLLGQAGRDQKNPLPQNP